MEAKMGKLMESIGGFFSGGDHIPWCEPDIVAGCEREVAEADRGSSDEFKSECIMRLSWVLVHSKRPEDVQRGIAMLDASLGGASSPLQLREKIYLLAVGYYRSGDYARSRQLVERCLEIAPDWRQALNLKKTIEDKIKKDGAIGIGIAATAIGLVVGGVAAAFARKKQAEMWCKISTRGKVLPEKRVALRPEQGSNGLNHIKNIGIIKPHTFIERHHWVHTNITMVGLLGCVLQFSLKREIEELFYCTQGSTCEFRRNGIKGGFKTTIIFKC